MCNVYIFHQKDTFTENDMITPKRCFSKKRRKHEIFRHGIPKTNKKYPKTHGKSKELKVKTPVPTGWGPLLIQHKVPQYNLYNLKKSFNQTFVFSDFKFFSNSLRGVDLSTIYIYI